MRYLFIGLILLSFIGCGSSTTQTGVDGKTTSKPDSPTPRDRSKQPPSIPNI